jgi:hemoglobin
MNRVTLHCLSVLSLLIAHSAAAGTSLYERLGGQSAMTAIADTLIERVVADPVLGRSFKGTKLPRIKEKLAEQLCELTGGPCKYTGDPMPEVHAGHHITEAEFYGMVESLRALLRERGAGLAETNELLRLLAPMKRDVVEGPARHAAP